MNTASNDPFKSPGNSAFDKFQTHFELAEKLRPQFGTATLAFKQLESFSEMARSLSSASQVARLFDSESFLAIRDLNRQMTLSDGLRDTIAQISSAAQAQRLAVQNEFSKASHFKIPVLPKMTGFDAFGESIKQFQQSVGELVDMRKYLADLQLHAFDGVRIDEIVKESGWANSGLAAAEAARKSLDDHWGKFLDTNVADLDGRQLEAEEVELATEAITQTSLEQRSLEEAVQQIIETIQQQKSPEMQLVLWMFFRKVMDWLVGGIVGAIMGVYAPAILGESPQVAQKIVQEAARTAVGTSELLSEYRYVAVAVLIIRQNPRAQSPQIARLSLGQAVKLIKKERDFALILWTDHESGVEIQGWVFARYLKKFN